MSSQVQSRWSNSIWFYMAQFFFGGWFTLHGTNHFVTLFTQPAGSNQQMHDLIAVLLDSGLFNYIKGIEVLTGIMFLTNRFVPLAVVLATPITLTIAYTNLTMGDTFGMVVGVITILVNGIVGIGYLEQFAPMLCFRAPDPSTRGLSILFGGKKD